MIDTSKDRLIKEGFPEGWYIQDRVGEGTALLCHKTWQGFSKCICLRPGAIKTDDWVPTAQAIAKGYALVSELEIIERQIANSQDDGA